LIFAIYPAIFACLRAARKPFGNARQNKQAFLICPTGITKRKGMIQCPFFMAMVPS